MTSIDSAENQKICMELARDNVNNLKSSVRKVTEAISAPIVKKNTLDIGYQQIILIAIIRYLKI
jgi:hypothetical protein